MNRNRSILSVNSLPLVFLFSLFWLPAVGQTGVEHYLGLLDKSLENKDHFTLVKLNKLRTLKANYDNAFSHEARFDAAMQLCDEYSSFRYDSAYHYANICIREARLLGNRTRMARARSALAFTFISGGMMEETRQILTSISPADLTQPEVRKSYYASYMKYWSEMAGFAKDSPFQSQYARKSYDYTDSLLSIVGPNTTEGLKCRGFMMLYRKDYNGGIKTLKRYLADGKVDAHNKAIVAAKLAWAYNDLRQPDSVVTYFAQSAIYDNECATREITALYLLAREIYKRGDNDRATRYVKMALEDITFYNARLRKVEIGAILPIIEQARYDAMRSQRNTLIIAVAIVALLTCVIGIGTIHAIRQNKKLRRARTTIDSQLEQMREANTLLTEANKIKVEYIGRSFYVASEFITKLEKLYLAIDRLIVTKHYDDIRKTVNREKLEEERHNMYAVFDETFTDLFPEFVDRYNALFAEADRATPKSPGRLTSEMRIFALIRLGINDSDRIAKFLDYSVHTINTYKTRVKNKSIVDNDQFERMIMEIA